MTDNEIIKGNSNWHKNFHFMELVKLIDNLEDQKYNFVSNKGKQTIAEAIEFMKKQYAEIESLEKENKLLIDRNCELAEKGEKAIITFVKSKNKIKAEAINEFAERLKEINNNRGWFCGVYNHDIDNLVKEMTEGGERK